MTDAVYRIVEHDGGWAYRLGDVFSETFPNRQDAAAAAARVAQEQQVPGEDEAISWEDEDGQWHDETARGTDRPHASVADVVAPTAAGRTEAAEPPSRAGTLRDQVVAAYQQGASPVHDRPRVDPMLTMLIAGLCGFLLGLVVRERR